MKKQFLAKILVVCMVLSMLSVAAFAVTQTSGEWTYDDSATEVVYTLNTDATAIPSTINAGTYKVTQDAISGAAVTLNANANLEITGTVDGTFTIAGAGTKLTLTKGATDGKAVYVVFADTVAAGTSAEVIIGADAQHVYLLGAATDAGTHTITKPNSSQGGGGGGGGGGGSTTTPSGNDTVTVNNNASADVANLGDNPTVVVTGKEDDTKFEATLVNGANKDTITVETPAGTVTVLDPSKVDKVTTEVGTDASGDTTYTVSVTKNGAAANTTITYAVPAGNTAVGNNLVVKKVNADGTETILPKSALDGSMMKVLLDGGATIKVVDNTKTFSDVSGHWAKDAIAFVTSRELFLGTSATNFSANAPMTRGMLVTVLHRLEGLPSGGSASFSDVASGEYYADAVAWASANGIVEGYANGTFRPGTRITREQLAVMLYRYVQKIGAASKGQTGSYAGFADSSSVSSWATDAMSWAVGSGILQGTGSNLNPGGNATRGEVATMLMRFVNLITK